MALLQRGHNHSSGMQVQKKQSSQASSPWLYSPSSRHTATGIPSLYWDLWFWQYFEWKLREEILCAEVCPVEETVGGGLTSCPTVALHRSLRVCLEDSTLLCGTAYTCSFTVNNYINFLGSPGWNRLRYMQQTGTAPGPPEQSPVSMRWSLNDSQDGRSLNECDPSLVLQICFNTDTITAKYWICQQCKQQPLWSRSLALVNNALYYFTSFVVRRKYVLPLRISHVQ